MLFGKKMCKVTLVKNDAERLMTVLSALGVKAQSLAFEECSVWTVKVWASADTMAVVLDNFNLEGGVNLSKSS